MSIQIKGKTVDDFTRCVHYHSALDVIAIKFKCCGNYYPCYFCHAETEAHSPQIWQKTEFEELAVFCGMCKCEMSLNNYLKCDAICPNCSANFNPKCENHYHLYFEE